MTASPDLKKFIQQRSDRRGLSVSLKKQKYGNQYYIDAIPRENSRQNVLVIGVGSGFDMVLNILEHGFQSVVGVDPYIAEDGNDTQDYETLQSLIESYDLTQRFTLHRATIQEFLATTSMKFDLILAMDVLHHIFVTTEELTQSKLYPEAVGLFDTLKSVLNPGGRFIISEVDRKGLRPWLNQKKLTHFDANYTTKQNSSEWTAALKEGGFTVERLLVYTPYMFRHFKWLLNNRFGLYTLCNRYYLICAKSTP